MFLNRQVVLKIQVKVAKTCKDGILDTQAICQTCIWLVLEAVFLGAPQ